MNCYTVPSRPQGSKLRPGIYSKYGENLMENIESLQVRANKRFQFHRLGGSNRFVHWRPTELPSSHLKYFWTTVAFARWTNQHRWNLDVTLMGWHMSKKFNEQSYSLVRTPLKGHYSVPKGLYDQGPLHRSSIKGLWPWSKLCWL